MDKSKALVAIVLAVILCIGVLFLIPKDQTPTAVAPANDATNSTSTPTPVTVSVTTASPYKDGSYTATGSYQSPAGSESIQVTLVLKDGIITDATVVSGAQDGMSKRYQNMFLSGYKALVVGKSIDQANLSVVSGSSLTPMGWNQAVANIKTQAAA